MGLFSKLIDKRLAAYQQELIETHYREVDNMYRQIRGWRHDYRNHIQTMKAYAAAGDWEAIRTYLDLLDEDSIAQAAGTARALGQVHLVIVASGVLHDARGLFPEKHWGALNAQNLAYLFAVNAIGPALVAKHFLPLVPRNERSVFAALSARVGSIEDNRTGGWYGYRASKAALNMLIRTLSIELERRAPQALCIGLHPGTVDTALSHPFQAGVSPDRLFSPDKAAEHLLRVIEGAAVEDNGRLLAWDGQRVPA